MQSKTAAIYNVWDGDELLRGSIEQIRNSVDVVIVVYSKESNTGEKYLPSIPLNLVDILFEYKVDLNLPAQQNELRKRQEGLGIAKAMDCTHFIFMDCDEYYFSSDFDFYKNQAIISDIDFTYCRLKTYYKTPTRQLKNEEDYFVPFVCKLKLDTAIRPFGKDKPFCDPTRTVGGCNSFLEFNTLRMHHYSFVRKDIERKLRNSSSAQAFKNVNLSLWNSQYNTGEMIYFGNQETIEVQNYFGIEL